VDVIWRLSFNAPIVACGGVSNDRRQQEFPLPRLSALPLPLPLPLTAFLASGTGFGAPQDHQATQNKQDNFCPPVVATQRPSQAAAYVPAIHRCRLASPLDQGPAVLRSLRPQWCGSYVASTDDGPPAPQPSTLNPRPCHLAAAGHLARQRHRRWPFARSHAPLDLGSARRCR